MNLKPFLNLKLSLSLCAKPCLKTISAVGLGLLISTQAMAETALQTYVNQLKTFTAEFEQVQPDESRFAMNEARGYFKLQRPGQLVWVYQKPEYQKIVVDGINLWVQDDDLEQITVRPINDIKADIPLSWLLYDEPIESRFDIIESGNGNGMKWFNLTPKQATYFQSIEIGLKDGKMKEVWMYQSADNITKVKFVDIKENQPISPSEFLVTIPVNFDLVGQPE